MAGTRNAVGKRDRPLTPGRVAAGSAAAALVVGGTVPTTLGVPNWHYTATFVLMAAWFAWRWKRYQADRALLGAHLLASAVLAVVTGFLLLYLKDAFKASGTKDWMKYWHCVVSMWFLYASIVHVTRNARAVGTYGRDAARNRFAWAHVVAWAATLVALGASVARRDLFRDENYLYYSTLTVLVATAVAYGGWIAWKVRTGAWSRGPPRVPSTRGVRGNVDLMMLGWAGLAQASGLVLLYGKTFLHGNGYKYVSKYWHTAPSVVVTLLLVAHVVLNLKLLLTYWRGRARRARAAAPTPTDGS